MEARFVPAASEERNLVGRERPGGGADARLDRAVTDVRDAVARIRGEKVQPKYSTD